MEDGAPNWFDPEVATFGDRLAAARETAGLDQRGLAERLGVKPSTIRKWENDLAEPRANRLSMMAGLLGVSMMWLINGTGDGIDTPQEGVSLDAGARELLVELRELRATLLAKSEQIGRLEKRVRAFVRETNLG